MIYSLITMSEALPTTNCFPKLIGMIPERWKVKNPVVRPREVEDPASVQMTIPCMCQPTESHVRLRLQALISIPDHAYWTAIFPGALRRPRIGGRAEAGRDVCTVHICTLLGSKQKKKPCCTLNFVPKQ